MRATTIRALGELKLCDATTGVAGNSEALEALRELIVWPHLYATEAEKLGVDWPTGLLLYGPPGCGKTFMTKAVCEESKADLHIVYASAIFGAFMGESEKTLRAYFEEAEQKEDANASVVLFFDEIDALCPRRSADRPHESRVVSQFLTLMDGVSSRKQSRSGGRLVVIGATNRPDALDPALRRHGRFDREVEVRLPQQEQRHEILKLHSADMPLEATVNLDAIAGRTNGYSGADLCALCRETAMHAISCVPFASSGDLTYVRMEDFEAALQMVSPSTCRSYEIDQPPVHWDEIGGLKEVKKKLQQAAEWPLLYRDAFERLGLQPAKGILLYGPPGCCKTTLARAVATACKARLFLLSCAQVFSMYSGEGEAIVKETFRRARSAAPSIVFLDEVDAMAPSRSVGDRSGTVERRLLSCLLTEMDGLEQVKSILTVAATNRPEVLDPAILRPGRLDLLLFVGPPDAASRQQILEMLTKETPLDDAVDFMSIVRQTENFSGAELKALCCEAALCALREDIDGAACVYQRHFEQALKGIEPQITCESIDAYKKWGLRHKKR